MLALLAISAHGNLYSIYNAMELKRLPAMLTHKNTANVRSVEAPPGDTAWEPLMDPAGKGKQSPKAKPPIWLAEITEFLRLDPCPIDSNRCSSAKVYHAHNYVNH